MREKLVASLLVLVALAWSPRLTAKGDGVLDDRLGKAVEAHGSGFDAVGKAHVEHLNKKGKETFEVKVKKGRCYRLFATGTKDAFKLELRAKKDGHTLGVTAGAVPLAVVDVCPSASGTLDVTVEAASFGDDVIFAAYARKSGKTPAKDMVAARLQTLAVKHVPGGKMLTPPVQAVLGKGKSFAVEFQVSEGKCYKVVSVGGAGVSNVDVEVELAGKTIVEDVTTGDHPIVEMCPEKGGKARATIRLVKGEGPVVSAAFEAPASTIVVGASDAQSMLDKRLMNEASIYAADMNLVGVLVSGKVKHKKSVTHDVNLSKGVCYKFIAVGGAGIEDLDITVREGKGKGKGKKGVLATDTTMDDAPIASHCADSSGPAKVIVSSKGTGNYSFGIFAGASTASGASGAYVDLVEAEAGAAKSLGKDWDDATELRTAVVGGETVASFDVKLGSQYCYSVVTVGLGTLAQLQVDVIAEGMKLGSSAKPGSVLVLEVCPDSDVAAAVKVSSSSGDGPVAVKLYRQASDIDQVFIPVGGLGKSYVAKALRKLHTKKGDQKPAVSDFMEGSLTPNKTKTFEVELEGGMCYTVLAVGVPSVKELQLKLITPLGEEAASGTGTQVVMETEPCPKWNGTYEVEVKMFMGYGAFGVQVFGK